MRAAILLVLGSGSAANPVLAADVSAGAPSDLAVTVYRAPERASGSINLDELAGFALISETRTVHLPPGVSRLRFAGVADGIETASAIVTGFPDGVIEKNREGKLLSTSALTAAAVGKSMTLLRTNKKTGKLTRTKGTIVSDADGVVFQTSEGVEALRCSGLPESFSFEGVADLAATPTLSVLVNSPQPATRTVTLSYLAHGFDWAADYIATLSPDGKTLDLGAWVTLANGNGIGFPSAHTQVVAGRVNRETGELEPLDAGGPILAQCWPRGSTSDSPAVLQFDNAPRSRMLKSEIFPAAMAVAAPALEELMVSGAHRVQQEQLGDLKLYRVPDRTTVASRQAKQVRLMDRSGIPIITIYGADVASNETAPPAPAQKLLRTTNSTDNHLGLPLPSGHVAIFQTRAGEKLLQRETNLRDLAVDEEVEFSMGDSPDVQLSMTREKVSSDSTSAKLLPLVPGVLTARTVKVDGVVRVDISNARAVPVDFELRLQLPPGGRVIRADHPLGKKNGRPMFRITIPANAEVTVRYQTDHYQPSLPGSPLNGPASSGVIQPP